MRTQNVSRYWPLFSCFKNILCTSDFRSGNQASVPTTSTTRLLAPRHPYRCHLVKCQKQMLALPFLAVQNEVEVMLLLPLAHYSFLLHRLIREGPGNRIQIPPGFERPAEESSASVKESLASNAAQAEESPVSRLKLVTVHIRKPQLLTLPTPRKIWKRVSKNPTFDIPATSRFPNRIRQANLPFLGSFQQNKGV